jgi:flagellar M-ring protein FliF
VAEEPKSPGQALSKVLEMLRGLTLNQRVLLVAGAVLVGATLWIFTSLMGRPHYVTLYSGLRPEEAQSLGARLAARNIPYQVSPDGGSLLVPADQLDASRLETASQGLPRSARLGFELFDSPNWAGSDFTEKVNYQRALEGELERTLQTLSEVQAARVHLVLPHDSLYTEQQTEAKAAVILKTRSGRLSDQAQIAVPQLVASAVEGLRPENVTVVDADTNTPLLRDRSGFDGRLAYSLDDELSKTLVLTLEPVVGEGHVRATVHVEYDLSTSENTDEVYDPKAVATLTEQKSTETAGGAGPAGIPGTASNLPGGTSTTVNVPPETQSSQSQSATYAVSKSTRHTAQPAGRIRRVSAAVLVDDAVDYTGPPGKQTATRRKRTPEEMKQIEQLAAAAIGLDTQRGDMLSLENLSFEQLPAEALSAPGRFDAIRRLLEQWSGVLRYAGVFLLFLIVYLLVLRPVRKEVIAAFRALPGQMMKGAKELATPGGAGSAGGVEIELPEGAEEAKRATTLKKQLVDKVRAEPAAASRLVQSWIREKT